MGSKGPGTPVARARIDHPRKRDNAVLDQGIMETWTHSVSGYRRPIVLPPRAVIRAVGGGVQWFGQWFGGDPCFELDPGCHGVGSQESQKVWGFGPPF